jgi:lysozyme family protein
MDAFSDSLSSPTRAFDAGYQFFMGPQYDGHLKDSAPSEHFTTKYGVTEMSYAGALAKGDVTKPFAQVNSPDDVKPIYKREYYDADRCGDMPACVGMVCFVDATLMGDHTPAMNLQRVLGVAVDGDIGDETLAALRAADARDVATKLEAADLAHLRTLPNWGLYENGWSHREENLLAEALKLCEN